VASGGLQEAIDRLYGVPLEDFVPERTRAARGLRAGGEKDAAKQLAKLPKPSAASWALNHVAREDPAAVQAWLAAAEELREASLHAAEVGGDRVRAAMAGHREATTTLTAVVAELARPGGRPLSEAMLDRVRSLLQAATADPEQADLLRAGRVTEEPAAGGALTPVGPPRAPGKPGAPGPGDAEPGSAPGEEEPDEASEDEPEAEDEPEDEAEDEPEPEVGEEPEGEPEPEDAPEPEEVSEPEDAPEPEEDSEPEDAPQPEPAPRPRRRRAAAKARASEAAPAGDPDPASPADPAAARRAELEELLQAAEAEAERRRGDTVERDAEAEAADERLQEARRTLRRAESEAAAALDAVTDAEEAALVAEREVRRLRGLLRRVG
jgi:hypothetical protein